MGQVEVQVPIERAENAREIAMRWERPASEESAMRGRTPGEGLVDELDGVDGIVAQTLKDEAERN